MMLNSQLAFEFCIAIVATACMCGSAVVAAGVGQKSGSLLARIVRDEAQHIAQRQRCGLCQLLLLDHLRIIVYTELNQITSLAYLTHSIQYMYINSQTQCGQTN